MFLYSFSKPLLHYPRSLEHTVPPPCYNPAQYYFTPQLWPVKLAEFLVGTWTQSALPPCLLKHNVSQAYHLPVLNSITSYLNLSTNAIHKHLTRVRLAFHPGALKHILRLPDTVYCNTNPFSIFCVRNGSVRTRLQENTSVSLKLITTQKVPLVWPLNTVLFRTSFLFFHTYIE